jgi:hypothetical protein
MDEQTASTHWVFVSAQSLFEPVQTPPEHLSFTVQKSLSLQESPSWMGLQATCDLNASHPWQRLFGCGSHSAMQFSLMKQ